VYSLQNSRHLTAVAMTAATLASSSLVWADTKSELRQSYVEAFGDQGLSSSVLEIVSRTFNTFDRDGTGISLAEIEHGETLQLAQLRAYTASRTLTFDLNGDLVVSRAEVEEAVMLQAGRHIMRLSENQKQKERALQNLKERVDLTMAADKNADGVIAGHEIYFAQNADRIDQQFKAFGGGFARALLKADPNQDGTLTEIEVSTVLAENLGGIEVDIAKAEADRREAQKLGMRAETCKPFDVAKDTQFIAFGAYEGTSLSTVTVAGQDDETTAATIIIEDGQEPLTLLLTSYSPMIWHIKGKTERIQKILLGGRKTKSSGAKIAVGLVGVAKEKVTFLSEQDCLRYFYDTKSTEAQIAKAVISKLARHPIDSMLGRYDINIVSLPSGAGAGEKEQELEVVQREAETHGVAFHSLDSEAQLKPLNVNPELYEPTPLESGMLHFNPTGLLDVNVRDVVSEVAVARYAVLPQEAGLMQLSYEGKLERIKGGWKVLSQTRFPAGLAGAHGTTFIVPKGVPLPEGSPGHSCVFLEDTAKTLGDKDHC
jgi:hypothetical protein